MKQFESLYISKELVEDAKPNKVNVVTGALSYTGKYITRKLLSAGERVRTLTGHPEKNLFGQQVEVFPYNFDKPKELTESLRGADTLYNTYWIKFPYGGMTFGRAVENTKTLVKSAKKAGVEKIVHISVTNADEESPFPYFKGKGIVEQFIKESDLSYAILRPALIFGKENILINNIAWFLRKFPIFGVFGDGSYRIRPIYVEDLADLAIDAANNDEDTVMDTVGPEAFTYNELIYLIKDKINSNTKVLHLPPSLPLFFSKIVGRFVNDIVVTEDEVEGLMAELLYSQEPPRGKTRLSAWLQENRKSLGARYASELKQHHLSGQRY